MSSTTCTICSDLFTASDEVYGIKCGHIFHHTCLLQWLERSKTCPQCRNKTTEKVIFRIYFNYSNSEGITLDAGSLQNKLDSVEFQLKEKKKSETIFQEEIQKLQDLYSKSQEKLNGRNLKLTEKDSTIAALKEQVNYLKVEHDTVDRLRSDKERLQQSLSVLKSLEDVLYGTASDVDKLLRDTLDPQSLCTYVSVLKKVVLETENKKKVLRESLRSVKNEVSKLKTENHDLMTKTVTVEESLSHAEDEIKSLKSQLESAKTSVKENCISSDESQSTLESCSSKCKRKLDSLSYDSTETKFSKYSTSASSSQESIVKSIEEATSPYLSLKQGSSALANLQLKNSAAASFSSPKANEYSIFKSNRLAVQVTNKNNEDLFKAMHQKRKERETNYDGLGGHSKTDTFPTPLSKNAIKLCNAVSASKNQSMKNKMKRLQRPPNQGTIKKAFQLDESLDL